MCVCVCVCVRACVRVKELDVWFILKEDCNCVLKKNYFNILHYVFILWNH